MEEKNLKELLPSVIENSRVILDKDPHYPPIANSYRMLIDIYENVADKNYLKTNQDRLNVGLLAAKSLDLYEEEEPEFYQYATSLHKVWAAVMSFIGKPFKKPTIGLQALAYKFYSAQGYDHDDIGHHLQGIDFSYPVGVIQLFKMARITQWKAQPIPQGNYYAEIDPHVSPDCLGIHQRQADMAGNIYPRIQHEYEVFSKYVYVLKSVAASVLDTWSILGQSFQTKGGCVQYFNKKDKDKFDLIHPLV